MMVIRRREVRSCYGHYRFWLVAKGFFQIESINFDELFSPAVYYKITCLFLVITALENWDIHSIDIKTAYLSCQN